MDNFVRIYCKTVDVLKSKTEHDSNNLLLPTVRDEDWRILILQNKLTEDNEEEFSVCKKYGELKIDLEKDGFDSKSIFKVHPNIGTKIKFKYFSINFETNKLVPIEESLLESIVSL